MRGGRRGGLWSEEEIASSGTGSERAKVASVAEGTPPRAGGPGDAFFQRREAAITLRAARNREISFRVVNGPGLTRTVPSGKVPSVRWEFGEQ